MTTIFDTERGEIIVRENGREVSHPMASAEGFAAATRAWLRATWDAKYVYSFSWLGRPIIQLPEDMIRVQEAIFRVKPDVLIETGVAHGGSLVFYASLFKCMGRGRVIGLDIEIRPQNRKAIEAHELAPLISLVEGDSASSNVVECVREKIRSGEKVMVILDSAHGRDHVLAELNAYAPMVSVGSYIVATDGYMAQIVGAPRTKADWGWNNPCEAVKKFVEQNPNFRVEEPDFAFNESMVKERVTYWPKAYIKRVA
ncbi:MAG: CmcI family methyltransferase [Xanthobacteraceae bacterium]|jgi:cephalosporin hydroxylase